MEILLLKKYTNRRLYDTEKSIYVTLDYVTTVIRKGRQISVEDAKTGEDVTASILTQIIMEEARKKNYLLPIPLLHLIIQYGETVLNDFFEKYLEHAIKNYLLFRDFTDDQYKKYLDYGGKFPDTNQEMINTLAPFKPIFDIFSVKVSDEKNKQNKK